MILALDLEHTLISSAVSCFIRPHLNDFIEWSIENFDQVVLFTTVSSDRVKDIQNKFYQMGDTNKSFQELRCVEWPRTELKDLSLVSENWQNVLMIDDFPEAYAIEAQRSQWIEIKPFDPSVPDTELLKVRDKLTDRLNLGSEKRS
jgi:uncharacterized membrane protein YheB (UPF0754 family)